jgi:hypothetical protein
LASLSAAPGSSVLRGTNISLVNFLVRSLVIGLALQFLLPINVASAASIGSSPCTTEVTNSATVGITTSGGYCYLVFKSGTNTWTVPAELSNVSLLLIGGGGAGGSGAWAGGGGAGGVLYDSSFSVTGGASYSTSVGAGGTAGANTLQIATNQSFSGSDTWFNSNSTLVAKGGGAGASYAWGQSAGSLCRGRDGGSGGGSTECNDGSINTGGATTQTILAGADAAYGNAGGSTPSANNYSGAGGGGAGAVGSPSLAAASPGRGGDGINNFSAWLTAIASSMSDVSGWSTATTTGYIAGGGGGASQATQVTGGFGGGGAGGVNTNSSTINGSAGVTNTGSGGGGSTYDGNSGTGGAGGSGLIIVRYSAVDTTPPSFNSFALAGSATTANFRTAVLVTANVTLASKVTFKANGKNLPGCKAKSTSGSGSSHSVTCIWKPSNRGAVLLSAIATSISAGISSPTAPQLNIRVDNRAGAR